MVTTVIRSPRILSGSLLLLAWLAALTALVLTTSNPVVLNRAQLRAAPLVVVARVTDLDSGRCDLEQRWGAPVADSSLTIDDLKTTGAREGESYLFALQPGTTDVYDIVPAGKERSGRPIYPATPELIAQWEEVLGE